jgi:RNA polymerase sigma-70 factor (ECF subfamily)
MPEHEWLDADQSEAPEVQFDRKWLHAILVTVMERMRHEFSAAGRERHFEVLKVFLTEDRGAHPYAEAAVKLGMSESGAKAAIWRLRQRYGELFRDEVARTVQDPSEVDDEIRHLLGLMK